MTRDELREKIKVVVRQIRKPDYLAADDTVSLDAPKFPVLEKFPSLKEIIIDLLTDQYELFIVDIQWVAPKPTTFRIILGNGEYFFLMYTPRSWVATVEGKKYYLANIGEEEQAIQSIARILSYGQQTEATEATGEAGATETGEEPSAAPEEPATEVPEETPEPEA
jgi:hypothetical protein